MSHTYIGNEIDSSLVPALEILKHRCLIFYTKTVIFMRGVVVLPKLLDGAIQIHIRPLCTNKNTQPKLTQRQGD